MTFLSPPSPPPRSHGGAAAVRCGRRPRAPAALVSRRRRPDTLDGRFDMVAAVLSMVILRLEDDPQGAVPIAQLTERFIDDMDAQVRQIGFGDMVVGEHDFGRW
ncbi:ubiquinol-cytochrome C chaperone family protein [Sphingomonas sp. MMS24-JH45]